jgi:hypothetical protein
MARERPFFFAFQQSLSITLLEVFINFYLIHFHARQLHDYSIRKLRWKICCGGEIENFRLRRCLWAFENPAYRRESLCE